MKNVPLCSEVLQLLFIDDDISVLSAYRRMLRLNNFDCLFMTDAEFRLDDSFVRNVDIAFVDQNMPHTLGTELLLSFKQVNTRAKRVLMSGDFTGREIDIKTNDIYHAVLPKPCSKELLLQCVATLQQQLPWRE